jgi:hypothetical protein
VIVDGYFGMDKMWGILLITVCRRNQYVDLFLENTSDEVVMYINFLNGRVFDTPCTSRAFEQGVAGRCRVRIPSEPRLFRIRVQLLNSIK